MTEQKHRKSGRRTAVIALAAALLLATGSAAYAADLGSIQRRVQLWLHGDQTDAVMTVEPGHYTLEYTDENGETQQRGGGGVAFEPDGTERPLTPEELMEHLNAPEVSYEDDGYDVDLIKVVLSKIADTVDFKASDYPKMEADAAAAINYVIGTDMEKDGEEYLSEFHLWERLLMIAQRQGHRTEEELGSVIKVDLKAFMKHFMQLARTVLPQWQYDDVKYYENFAYALLSQFTDLFGIYNNELMMDVADLYILHEDYRHGDADYGYLIRENQIKDYVYYRFAHVYEDIDLDKAKGIAYESLQYVDGRYDYYQPIIDILNRQ